MATRHSAAARSRVTISTRFDRAHTNSLENISTDKGLTFPGKNRAGSLEYVLPLSIYFD
jgi:hypothetical protein